MTPAEAEHLRAQVQTLRNVIVRAEATIRGILAKTDTADPELLRAANVLADGLAFARDTQ